MRLRRRPTFRNAREMYGGRRVAFLTQHGKESLLGPVLAQAIGCVVERVEGYDTDELGTFTREVPRAGSQLEAARRKARIGMRLSGSPIGLASEGAFIADPVTGLLPWNLEIVVFIDDDTGVEIVGIAEGHARNGYGSAREWQEMRKLASDLDFPSHHLVVRPNDEHDTRIRKGIHDWHELEAAFEWAAAQSKDGVVHIESDLRACCNPTRRSLIQRAAEDLAKKLLSPCPRCCAPGFWVSEGRPGLPCAECGSPTQEPIALVSSCVMCKHTDEKAPSGRTLADPARCYRCNP